MNRKNLMLGAAMFALAGISSLQAASTGFVRPVVAYVSPTTDGYDDAGYLGVQVGAFIGANRNHEFSGEIGATGWETDERFGSFRVEGLETYVPFLANYRYYVGAANAPVRFSFGPSLGFTAAAYEIEVSGPGTFQKDDSGELLFTAAANLGLDFRINDRFAINLGYRYLYIDGSETELLGVDVEFDEAEAHIVSLGFTVRF